MPEEGGGRGRTEIAAGPHWFPAKYPFRGSSGGGGGWSKKTPREREMKVGGREGGFLPVGGRE